MELNSILFHIFDGMIRRISENRLQDLSRMYKVVAVTGPRQSGKTTLVQAVFPGKSYENLEFPDARQYALEDPRGFLSQYPNGAILDEIQRVPELFSYLQGTVDKKKESGQFIVSGSNNFLLNEKISQSLAGRVGYLYLLPFSLEEIQSNYPHSGETDYIFNGFYPPVYDQKIPVNEWIPNYIRTYIDRDVRQIKNISNLLVFEKFLRLLAGRTGQELNYTSLSIEAGVDVKTIQSWIGILESSFIIFLLKPYHKNYNKTIVKRPKLYFYDTAVVCSLLRISKLEHLTTHPLKGALFECFVISEIIKNFSNRGKSINLYYWRDKTGREIDLIIDEPKRALPIEIKAGKTVQTEFFTNIRYWLKLTGNKTGKVIYAGDYTQKRTDGLEVITWKELNTITS